MIIEALWVSQQGTRTSDNRDHAGIGIRQGEFLGVVVDGSTNGAANGEYARSIVQMLVDWFVETGDVITDDLIAQVLRELHENLRKRYPRGSASLLLIYAAESNSISVIHSGDCVLGELDTHDGINWRTSPHTLTNALVEMPLKDIAQSATRHLLTRSFRARGFELPDIVELPEFSGSLVLDTDGFWAELSEKDQARFLGGDQASTATDRDDRSVLLLRISLSNHLAFVMYDKSSKNLYRRTTDETGIADAQQISTRLEGIRTVGPRVSRLSDCKSNHFSKRSMDSSARPRTSGSTVHSETRELRPRSHQEMNPLRSSYATVCKSSNRWTSASMSHSRPWFPVWLNQLIQSNQ